MSLVRVIAAGLVTAFACVQGGAATLAAAPCPNQRAGVLYQVQRRVGPAAIDCGQFFGVRTFKEPGPSRTELEAALACGRNAQESKKPCFFVANYFGIDAAVAHGILGSDGGGLGQCSYGCGLNGGPQFSIRACKDPSLRDGTAGAAWLNCR